MQFLPCAQKQPYDSGEAAHRSLRSIFAQRRALKNHQLAVYKCPHCEFWHIGHKLSQNGSTRKGRRKRL